MFTLYKGREIEWELRPEDFAYICSPEHALEQSKTHYDLDQRNYRSRFSPFSVPERLYSRQPTWRRAQTGYVDPIYDSIKEHLQLGWLIGVDTTEQWNWVENPFYVDENGDLICDRAYLYHEWFIRQAMDAYEFAVAERQGVKALPTQKYDYGGWGSAPVQHAQSTKTINSKAAGRLLAAGGVYNGNIADYAKTAQQLGGEAPAGYDQMLNETTAGSAIAIVSAAAGLGLGRMGAAGEISQLEKLTQPQNINGFTLEQLSDGAKLLDKGDLTQAGRALQKHGGRIGSAFPPVKGNTAAINEQGQSIVDGILNDESKKVLFSNTGRFGQVTDIIATDGRGLRYDPQGKLIGFLEPPK
ncbi:hypothetical protein [Rahnella ecdela]|uniref:DUF8093 domain-containing protein n=1 Tax=Rahnella ecdela TaxID=2816250 RepID=A0ABS6LJW9_9GAMM|nr:hypothetical protein [Rahnella ecdela]MBU9847145.1 hypothetical protein [Rahnella ecdela]